MKNNKWPALDEKPDAFVQKQKDDLEDIANVILFALDVSPSDLSESVPAYMKRGDRLHNQGTDKNEN